MIVQLDHVCGSVPLEMMKLPKNSCILKDESEHFNSYVYILGKTCPAI